jgi:hypothetical protein
MRAGSERILIFHISHPLPSVEVVVPAKRRRNLANFVAVVSCCSAEKRYRFLGHFSVYKVTNQSPESVHRPMATLVLRSIRIQGSDEALGN